MKNSKLLSKTNRSHDYFAYKQCAFYYDDGKYVKKLKKKIKKIVYIKEKKKTNYNTFNRMLSLSLYLSLYMYERIYYLRVTQSRKQFIDVQTHDYSGTKKNVKVKQA